MNGIKKRIEENFQSIKESLSSQDKEQPLKLPRIQKEWFVRVCFHFSSSMIKLNIAIFLGTVCFRFVVHTPHPLSLLPCLGHLW